MRTFVASLVALGLGATAASARADAWSVAQKVIPGGMTTIVGVDVTRVKGTAAEDTLRRLVDGSFRHVLRDAPDLCGVDPWQRLASIVAVLDERETGALFIQLKNTSADDVVACLRKALHDDDVTVRHQGNQILVEEDGRPEMALGWIDGVLVVAFRKGDLPDKRSLRLITQMTGGGGVARDAILIRALRDVDTSAPVWGIVGERMVWDGRNLDRPRQEARAVRPPPRRARAADPFLLAQPAPPEPMEGGGEAAEPAEPEAPPPPAEAEYRRTATMLYAVGQLSLGSTMKARVAGRFTSDGEWVQSSAQQRLTDHMDELTQHGVTGRISRRGDLIQLDAEMSARAFGELVHELK